MVGGLCRQGRARDHAVRDALLVPTTVHKET